MLVMYVVFVMLVMVVVVGMCVSLVTYAAFDVW